MNTSFERCANTTDEWYTPKWIIDALGEFDLDPCAPEHRLWNTAKRHITAKEDGLKNPWGGGKSMAQSALFKACNRTFCGQNGGKQQRDCVAFQQMRQQDVSGPYFPERGGHHVCERADKVLQAGRYAG